MSSTLEAELTSIGFKYLPSIGNLIVDAIEDKLASKIHELTRWNPKIATDRDWRDTLGRPNEVMDFHDVKDWTNVKQRDISKL